MVICQHILTRICLYPLSKYLVTALSKLYGKDAQETFVVINSMPMFRRLNLLEFSTVSGGHTKNHWKSIKNVSTVYFVFYIHLQFSQVDKISVEGLEIAEWEGKQLYPIRATWRVLCRIITYVDWIVKIKKVPDLIVISNHTDTFALLVRFVYDFNEQDLENFGSNMEALFVCHIFKHKPIGSRAHTHWSGLQ